MAFLILILIICLSQIAIGIDVRIIDGLIAKNGQYPYAVVFYYDTLDGRNFCNGSLVSNKWILTAAHCLGGSEYTIYLGAINIEQIHKNALIIKSTSSVIYPAYDPTNLEDDIGLLELPSSVTFSENIKPVELPNDRLGANEIAIALGWGVTAEDQIYPSNLLRHVSLTTLSNAVCRRTYGDFIKENMICLTGATSQGICGGDSGGPLVQITTEGKHIQVGIASFYSGHGCERGHPSGFTRTFEYLDWIRNIIGQSLEVPTEIPSEAPSEAPSEVPSEEFPEAPAVVFPESPSSATVSSLSFIQILCLIVFVLYLENFS